MDFFTYMLKMQSGTIFLYVLSLSTHYMNCHFVFIINKTKGLNLNRIISDHIFLSWNIYKLAMAVVFLGIQFCMVSVNSNYYKGLILYHDL